MIINERKYKKCKENQIKNPKTNRCIKKPNIKKINLFKKLFNPFINRINANINDRIKYNNLLNSDETNNCMRLYKYDTDGKPLYIKKTNRI
jgi:hypothetical protein